MRLNIAACRRRAACRSKKNYAHLPFGGRLFIQKKKLARVFWRNKMVVTILFFFFFKLDFSRLHHTEQPRKPKRRGGEPKTEGERRRSRRKRTGKRGRKRGKKEQKLPIAGVGIGGGGGMVGGGEDEMEEKAETGDPLYTRRVGEIYLG